MTIKRKWRSAGCTTGITRGFHLEVLIGLKTATAALDEQIGLATGVFSLWYRWLIVPKAKRVFWHTERGVYRHRRDYERKD